MNLDLAYKHNKRVSETAFLKMQKAWRSGIRQEALGALVDEIFTEASASYMPSRRNYGTWSDEERSVLREAYSICDNNEDAYAYAGERLLRDRSQIRGMSVQMKLRKDR